MRLIAAVCLILLQACATAGEDGPELLIRFQPPEAAPASLTVELAGGTTVELARQAVHGGGVRRYRVVGEPRVALASLIQALEARADIDYAEPNRRLHHMKPQNPSGK